MMMDQMTENSAAKFDRSRAEEYGRQSRIALAGYDACHELSACMLSVALSGTPRARILVVGAGGTAGEIIAASRLGPEWEFVAVDPSPAMMDVARINVVAVGLEAKVDFILGNLYEVSKAEPFDAAIMIGVLHHLPGDQAKHDILQQLTDRLKPGAPLVLAGNYRAYDSEPLFMAAWAERWRMNGEAPDAVRAKLDRILSGAEPPRSEEAVAALLAGTGFEAPLRFFASLFWGAWFTRRSELA